MSRNYEKQRIFVGVIVILILSVSVVALIGLNTDIFKPTDTTDPNNSIYNYESVHTINNTVANAFAPYIPYNESFSLNAPVYSIDSDLSNIENYGSSSIFSSSEIDMIAQNGFVCRSQTEYTQIHEILFDNEYGVYPNFISSDAVLHAFHVVYDLALREVEVYSFWDLLGNLTVSLAEDSYDQYQNAPEGRWKDAALRNTAFFYVAAYLVDNTTVVPTEVYSDVSEVLDLMDTHTGISDQWFMGYDEDFSQYVPRGHYTRSETLEKYFMAMMWYGRIAFHLQPEAPPLPNGRGMNETAQAILISLALDNEIESVGTEVSGYDIWDAIYQPTAFFVGTSDDLLPSEYFDLIESIYGVDPSFAHLDNDTLLNEFISSAFILREPLILSSILLDLEYLNQTMGMRFMGQRFVPDSYILGQLVYKYVGTLSEPRLLPKGLDVMAALGSDRAWELLEDQKTFENYTSQMELMWETVDNITEREWTKNLYYLWLYSLLPLLTDPGEGYPLFMQSEAWVDKQLNTALGSWTELKHDTILGAKQPYTYVTAMPPQKPSGYVEPMPRVYARLAALCTMMISGLDQRDLMSDLISQKLETLESFLLSMKEISVKELSGQSLNDTENSLIEDAADILSEVVYMPNDEHTTSDADDSMALVTDVHTDINTAVVLQESVGYPLIIYVAVSFDGEVYLTRGGTFSYYEFTQPMGDRLTDEAWQDMLEAGEEPSLPDWTSSFIAESGGEALAIFATTVSNRNE